MARARNVEGLAVVQKCDKCYYLLKIERGEYDCKKQMSSKKVELANNGKCLNHWNPSKAEYEKGSWHGY